MRDNRQQVALPVGSLRPSAGEKVRVQLTHNVVNGHGNYQFAGIRLQHPNIISFAAHVLDEVRIAERGFVDDFDGLVRELYRTFGIFKGLGDCVTAVLTAESVQRDYVKHALGECARFDQFRKQRRQSAHNQHQGQSFALQRLKDIQQKRQGELVSIRVVRKILRLVVREDNSALA